MAEEKIIIGTGTKYPLNGILTIPDDRNGLCPAVVLVQGFGPSNMDEKVGNNYPFKDLADGLSEKEYKVAQHVDKQVINDISDWIFSI